MLFLSDWVLLFYFKSDSLCWRNSEESKLKKSDFLSLLMNSYLGQKSEKADGSSSQQNEENMRLISVKEKWRNEKEARKQEQEHRIKRPAVSNGIILCNNCLKIYKKEIIKFVGYCAILWRNQLFMQHNCNCKVSKFRCFSLINHIYFKLLLQWVLNQFHSHKHFISLAACSLSGFMMKL